jgi:hypothetical protein
MIDRMRSGKAEQTPIWIRSCTARQGKVARFGCQGECLAAGEGSELCPFGQDIVLIELSPCCHIQRGAMLEVQVTG